MKLYDENSNWSQIKDLFVYPDNNWRHAYKSWVYDGTAWKIFYPNFPDYNTMPTVGTNPIVGSVLTASSDWISTYAYGNGDVSQTAISYQWKKNSVNILNQTSKTYTTLSTDVGNFISCAVTATNQRGSTTVVSNSILVVPSAVTNLSYTDLTPIPANPVFTSTSGGINSWSASWSGSASYFSVTSSNGTVVMNGSNSASSSNASPGTAYVYVTAVNTPTSLRVSWTASYGAEDYYISYTGSANGNTTTSNTYVDIPVSGNITVYIYPRVIGAFGEGAQITGGTSSKTSSQITSSAITVAAPIYAPSYVNASLSISKTWYSTSQSQYFVTTGKTISASASSDGTSPVTLSYQWQINYGSGFTDISGSTGTSFTIGSSMYGGEVRCAVKATNSAGTLTGYTESSGAIVSPNTAPKSPQGTALYNDNSPHGGSLNYTVEPNNAGVGTGYFNWSYGPSTIYEWEMYKSTTATPGTTVTSSGTRFYFDTGKVSTTQVGYFWFRIRSASDSQTVYSSWVRVPSSGTVQFT